MLVNSSPLASSFFDFNFQSLQCALVHQLLDHHDVEVLSNVADFFIIFIVILPNYLSIYHVIFM
ncbi:hypothetical protein BDK62_1307 [Halomonas alkaliantarctica]|nr:hypothetical protein BDK62_1307 [Halomonas alkaliantarctica]